MPLFRPQPVLIPFAPRPPRYLPKAARISAKSRGRKRSSREGGASRDDEHARLGALDGIKKARDVLLVLPGNELAGQISIRHRDGVACTRKRRGIISQEATALGITYGI